MTAPLPVGPCRFCRYASWQADERGPIHRCCVRAETAGLKVCIACQESHRAAARNGQPRYPMAEADLRYPKEPGGLAHLPPQTTVERCARDVARPVTDQGRRDPR